MPSSTATKPNLRDRLEKVLSDPANAEKGHVEIAKLVGHGCKESMVRRFRVTRDARPEPKTKPERPGGAWTQPEPEAEAVKESEPRFRVKRKEHVEIAKLRVDLGTQMRGPNDQRTIDDYAELREEGHEFPPVDVFDTGKMLILAHGHHRAGSALKVGDTHIWANIYEGDIRAAMLFAVMSNRDNPLSRSVQAKKNAVGTLLGDPEWSKFSLNKIAKTAGVSFAFAKQCLEAFQAARGGGVTVDPVKTVERNGKTFEMNTGAIGPGKKPVEDEEPQALRRAEEKQYLESLPLHKELKGEAHSIFVEDALLHYRLEQGRSELEGLFRQHLRKVHVAERGRYRSAVESFMGIKHPRFWRSCNPCKATGAISKACCNSCGGRGYHVEGLKAVQV